MALHKINAAFFIDGQGRDEEDVAQQFAEGLSGFGAIGQVLNDFPAGLYLGGEVVTIVAPSEEETQRYSDG